MGTNREADIVGSLTNVSTGLTLGTVMLKEQRFGDCSFFYDSFLLDFHVSNFILGVSCAPNIEPSSTGRSTVDSFSALYSHFGQISLTSCQVAVAAGTLDTTDECCLSSDFATQCQPRPQLDFFLKYPHNSSNH